jgi:hypothetical protein
LKTLSIRQIRVGLREAFDKYEETQAGSEAERFAINAVKCWVDELTERLAVAKPKGYVYVAGPMRGKPEFNFPAFKRATELLRSFHYEVFSPAENDLNKGFDPKKGDGFAPTGETTDALRSALSDDTKWICEKATHIYMLKGWEKSTGATAEHALAKALGLEIMYEGDAK